MLNKTLIVNFVTSCLLSTLVSASPVPCTGADEKNEYQVDFDTLTGHRTTSYLHLQMLGHPETRKTFALWCEGMFAVKCTSPQTDYFLDWAPRATSIVVRNKALGIYTVLKCTIDQ